MPMGTSNGNDPLAGVAKTYLAASSRPATADIFSVVVPGPEYPATSLNPASVFTTIGWSNWMPAAISNGNRLSAEVILTRFTVSNKPAMAATLSVGRPLPGPRGARPTPDLALSITGW